MTPTTVEVRCDGGTQSVPAALVITTQRVAGRAGARRRPPGRPASPPSSSATPLDARGFEGITRDAEDTARALAV